MDSDGITYTGPGIVVPPNGIPHFSGSAVMQAALRAGIESDLAAQVVGELMIMYVPTFAPFTRSRKEPQ